MGNIFVRFTIIVLALTCAFTAGTIVYYGLHSVLDDYLFWSLFGFTIIFIFCFGYWIVYKLINEGLKDIDDISTRYHDAKNEIKEYKKVLDKLSEEAAKTYFDNKVSLLNDATSWAIHFSNARLGIMAIAIPITLVTVAVNFTSLSLVGWVSIWVVWLAAISSFFALTRAQGKKLMHRHDNLVELGVSQCNEQKTIRKRLLTDWHVRIVIVLTLFLFFVTLFRFNTCKMESPSIYFQTPEHQVKGDIVGTPNTETGKISYEIDATVMTK